MSDEFNEKLDKVCDEYGVTKERVLEELATIAFASKADFFDKQGNLIPIHKLGRRQARQLASVEIIVKNAQAGDGHMDTVHKLRLWDKTKALEMLAKYHGLLQERVEHSGEVKIKWQDADAEGK